jgi:hypothetical protein
MAKMEKFGFRGQRPVGTSEGLWTQDFPDARQLAEEVGTTADYITLRWKGGVTLQPSGTVCQGSAEPVGDHASGKRRGFGAVSLYRDGASSPGLPSQSGDRKRRSGRAGRI